MGNRVTERFELAVRFLQVDGSLLDLLVQGLVDVTYFIFGVLERRDIGGYATYTDPQRLCTAGKLVLHPKVA